MTEKPPATGATILDTTNRVGQAVQKSRREIAETTAVAKAIYDLVQPTGEENPVLEALNQVLLALRHHQQTLDEMSTRLDRIEKRLHMPQ